MAKIAQLAGLNPAEAYRLTDFQVNYLAHAVADSLMKAALKNPASLSPQMTLAVRARTSRIARSFREQAEGSDGSDGGGIGSPPED